MSESNWKATLSSRCLYIHSSDVNSVSTEELVQIVDGAVEADQWGRNRFIILFQSEAETKKCLKSHGIFYKGNTMKVETISNTRCIPDKWERFVNCPSLSSNYPNFLGVPNIPVKMPMHYIGQQMLELPGQQNPMDPGPYPFMLPFDIPFGIPSYMHPLEGAIGQSVPPDAGIYFNLQEPVSPKGRGRMPGTKTTAAQPSPYISLKEKPENFLEIEAMIKVTNIPEKTHEDVLLFFFKNCGGGTMVDLEYDPDTKSAVITFEEPEAVKRLVAKSPFLFNGVKIDVEEFLPDTAVHVYSPSEEAGEDSENILEVRGVSSKISEESVMIYFENTRRSGGGDIKSIKSEDGIFYIVFEDENVIEKVLTKQHKIDRTAIEVCRYVPPTYSNKVFLTNISEKTTKDKLENFLESKTNVNPVSIEYGEEKGTALITFEKDIDFEKLQMNCKKKTLNKSYLEIYRVPITNCAIVRNISERTSRDTLEFYFDNVKRSGVSGVLEVKMLDGFCLVYFEEPEAVDVVCRRPHRIDEQNLDVKIYYECLRQVEPFKLPAPLVISDSDPRKLHFLIKSQSKQQALETQLKAVYGKPIWPKETIASSFTVKCTLTPETKDCRKLARTWETNVKESLTIVFNQLNAEPDPSDLAMYQHYIECQTCGSYSEFYCNACHQRMCRNCRDQHLKNPDNTKHDVCNYKERKLKLSSIPCKLHPSQLLALCCKKCQQAICALCTTKEHEGHGFLDLEEVYTKNHQMRLDQIRRIRDDMIPQCRLRLKEAKNARDETKEYVELLKSIMRVQAFKIKELVDAILTENEQILQRFESSAVQKLENQETALNIYITQMQTLLECHNQSISCANPVEFLSKMNETPIVDFDPTPEVSKINPLVFTDGKINKDEIRKQFGALSK